MIYNSSGEPIELLTHCGQYRPGGGNCLAVLVQARHRTGRTWHYFAQELRASGGVIEIAEAVAALPRATLVNATLRRALREAS
jgi:hypothetical protein